MPINLSALLQSGQTHHRAGQLKEAEACYQQLLILAPSEPTALYLMGMLEQQRGRLDSAERFIRAAIANNPNQPRFYIHLGSILMKQSRIEDALALLRMATQQLPMLAELHDGVGVLLEMKGLSAEAAQIVSTSGHAESAVLARSAQSRRLSCPARRTRRGDQAMPMRSRASAELGRGPALSRRRVDAFEAKRGGDRPVARGAVPRSRQCQDRD